ncbi:MAG: Gfo/Idh/MocA family oxidoreductase [bacterium]
MIRAAILSFAHLHANSYAQCLHRHSGIEFCAVYDEDSACGGEQAQRYGAKFYQDAMELLRGEKPDFAIVCAENVRHCNLVLACAEAGVHCMCEKPIATTVGDANEMIKACTDAGVHLMTCFPVRYSPPVVRFREMVRGGRAGLPLAASCTNHGRMPPGWFLNKELAGGGAVIDHTVHVADLLRWILDREAVRVYAEVGHGLLHPGLGIDDVGLLTIEYEDGFFATLDTSWSRPAIFPTWGDVTIRMTGTDGVLQVDAFQQELEVYSDRDGRAEWQHWGENIDMLMIDDFVNHLLRNEPPAITGEDGLRALETALCAYQSAKTNKPVDINDIRC